MLHRWNNNEVICTLMTRLQELSYLNPAIAFCIMESSELLSKTKDRAATVGPQMRLNKSWSNDPDGVWVKTPSLVFPLLSKTCIKYCMITVTNHQINSNFKFYIRIICQSRFLFRQRTRQIIQYQATATLRQLQIYTTLIERGVYKTNGNILKFWQMM